MNRRSFLKLFSTSVAVPSVVVAVIREAIPNKEAWDLVYTNEDTKGMEVLEVKECRISDFCEKYHPRTRMVMLDIAQRIYIDRANTLFRFEMTI